MEQITIENVEKVLDEKVRPDLALHGGDIQVLELSDNVLKVRMLGHCSGCPSAELTMESLVDTALKEAFPQLKQVALVTGVSDSLIAQAREMLRIRHQNK